MGRTGHGAQNRKASGFHPATRLVPYHHSLGIVVQKPCKVEKPGNTLRSDAVMYVIQLSASADDRPGGGGGAICSSYIMYSRPFGRECASSLIGSFTSAFAHVAYARYDNPLVDVVLAARLETTFGLGMQSAMRANMPS